MRLTIDVEKPLGTGHCEIRQINVFDNYKSDYSLILKTNYEVPFKVQEYWDYLKPCIPQVNCSYYMFCNIGNRLVTYVDLRLLKSKEKQKNLFSAHKQNTRFTCLKPLVSFMSMIPLFFDYEPIKLKKSRTSLSIVSTKAYQTTLEEYMSDVFSKSQIFLDMQKEKQQ